MGARLIDPIIGTTAPTLTDRLAIFAVGVFCVTGGAALFAWGLQPLVRRLQGRAAARDAERFAHLNDRSDRPVL